MYFKILIAASLAANFLPVNAENEYLAKAESMHPASAVVERAFLLIAARYLILMRL